MFFKLPDPLSPPGPRDEERPRPKSDRERDRRLRPERERDRDRESERPLEPDRSRGPLARRFAARPPTTDSMMCRLDFLSGSLSRKPSMPAAPSAAVATRWPFAPAHPPGSLRLRTASMTPVTTAAFAACCHFLRVSRLRDLLRLRSDRLLRLLRLRPPRDLLRLLDLPVRAATTPPRPTPSASSSTLDLRRSRRGRS